MKTRLQELEDEVQAAEALSQEDREREYGTQGLGLLKAEVARLKWNDASAFYANVYEIWKECTDNDLTIGELLTKARKAMDGTLGRYQEARQAAK